MKTHPVEPETVMAYHDGQLAEPEASEIRAHVQDCAECQALVADLAQVSTRMQDWAIEGARFRAPEMPSLRRWIPRWVLLAGVASAFLFVVFTATRHATESTFHPAVLKEGIPLPPSSKGDHIAGPSNALPSSGLARDEGPAFSATSKVAASRLELKAEGLAERRLGSVDQTLAKPQAQAEPTTSTGPMIIRTASLTLLAKNFPTIRESMERIVSNHHGFVRQLETSGHAGTAQSFDASLMVPSPDLGGVLVELRALGVVEEEKQGGEEVTQQHADLVARLNNARNTEKRLTEVLATRTGKLSDVLEVEREIARVRGEIESMDSELRNMDKRIQYATITLRVAEEFKAQIDNNAPSVNTRLWNASVDGIQNLVDMVLGLTEFALRGMPVMLFWAILLFFPARWIWRTARAHGHLQ